MSLRGIGGGDGKNDKRYGGRDEKRFAIKTPFPSLSTVPQATIVGREAVHMRAGSDLNITCIITGATQASPVTWNAPPSPGSSRRSVVEEVNAGVRGGVQLVTDRRAGTSWLLVTQATWRDAGTYTCSPAHALPASLTVHVLDEETPAAMQPHLQPSTPLTPLTPGSTSSTFTLSSSSPLSSHAGWPIYVLTILALLRPFFKTINSSWL
ncbi:uncharacterized protein LOC121870439 [Homarus americanus]|uniref:uncharacterized protein LOC121870439 n=1 Tax=Homarus americanus TaxID=6706 RepID=UPI001C4655C8|nr:uncharacterized protein LOC121870439 [Homarus americanus]